MQDDDSATRREGIDWERPAPSLPARVANRGLECRPLDGVDLPPSGPSPA